MTKSGHQAMTNGVLTALARAWDAASTGSSRARQRDALRTAEILEALWWSLHTEDASALAELVKGAERASARLPAFAVPPDNLPPDAPVAARVRALITRPGGASLRLLAQHLFTSAMRRDLATRHAAPGSLLDGAEARTDELAGRLRRYASGGDCVFVQPETVKGFEHREGATPRNKQGLCRCATCVADRIVGTAERALDVKLAVDGRGKRRAAKR